MLKAHSTLLTLFKNLALGKRSGKLSKAVGGKAGLQARLSRVTGREGAKGAEGLAV